MVLYRIDNPSLVHGDPLAQSFEAGADRCLIQFSALSAYDDRSLKALDLLCSRYGSKLQVRFWLHHETGFDCRSIRLLPSLKSLAISTTKIVHPEALEDIPNLEEFSFSVYESDLPHLLEIDGLTGVDKLTIAGTRRNAIDLSPLARLHRLDSLFIQSHMTGVQVLGQLRSVKKLGLSGMPKNLSLDFVNEMKNLRSLKLGFGGRENLNELTHDLLQTLVVTRIRELKAIKLSGFPSLVRCQVEDQLHVQILDIGHLTQTLEELVIRNCTHLLNIEGVQFAQVLERLWLERTAINPEILLTQLPNSLKRVSLCGYGRKKDTVLKNMIAQKGYFSAIAEGPKTDRL